MSNKHAVGHFLLIRVEETEKKTKGGIVIPDTVRDSDRRAAEVGVVLEIGPTAWKVDALGGEPWVNVGDRIFFAKYSGKWVKDPQDEEDEELLIIRDEDVVGVIE